MGKPLYVNAPKTLEQATAIRTVAVLVTVAGLSLSLYAVLSIVRTAGFLDMGAIFVATIYATLDVCLALVAVVALGPKSLRSAVLG